MAVQGIESGAQIPIAGSWTTREDRITVRNPYDGAVVAEVSKASPADIEAAIAAAHAAFERTRRIPAHERSRVLGEVSRRITAEREALARTLTLETGKPIRDARVEVDRATLTFAIAVVNASRSLSSSSGGLNVGEL